MKTLLPSIEDERVIAVVVSYNPEKSEFVRLIEALLAQVFYVVVVDNASSIDLSLVMAEWSGQNIELLQMPENFGIATAQNVGIERAMSLGARFILLSDQDSVPSANMVAELLYAIATASSESSALPVAAAGPAIIDSRTGETSFFVIERSGFPCRWKPQEVVETKQPFVQVGFLIASGTLIPIEVIKRIGGMRSNYFIDHVDTEWCFRAKAAGYRLLGVPSGRLQHRLGESVKKVWFFGSREVMYHSPLRDYYMFRNTIMMLRDTAMSRTWQFHFLWRLVQFSAYFLLCAEGKVLRSRQMLRGLLHGLSGLSGRLESKTNRCCSLPISRIEPISA